MKRYLVILFVFIICYTYIQNIAAQDVKIPNNAIRVRVIANSNSIYDQEIKLKVKEEIENQLFSLLENVSSIEEARDIIKNNLDDINDDVNKLLKSLNYNLDYSVIFGNNYFPNKSYKGIDYKEGYYESLVITLGSGKGNNWWCVLFPPLCLLEAEESNNSDIEYTFFVKELLKKFL